MSEDRRKVGTATPPWLVYPEIIEWDWVRELKEASAGLSDDAGSSVGEPQSQPIPLNLVLAILSEQLKRPEIVKLRTETDPNSEDEVHRAKHILLWFAQYIDKKFENQTMAYLAAQPYLRRVLRGEYQGLNDPRLHQDLLSEKFIGPDDGVSYGG